MWRGRTRGYRAGFRVNTTGGAVDETVVINGRSILMNLYANYQANNYEESLEAADRFIRGQG